MYEERNVLRKSWLWMTLLCYTLPSALFWMEMFAAQPDCVKVWIGCFVFTFVLQVPFLLVLWHCAYRKYGTKYLTLVLLTAPFGMLVGAISFFVPSVEEGMRHYFANSLTTFSLSLHETQIVWGWVFIAAYLISMGVWVWWYILSFKLRRMNKKIRQEIRIVLQNSDLPKQYQSVLSVRRV